MVTGAPVFHHLDAGTPAEEWNVWAATHPVPVLDLAPFASLLVVAAHPDDETLGAGGLLHRADRAGLHVEVVVASNGEASHPDSVTTTPEQLAAVRGREVMGAVGILAPSARVELLGRPDGRLGAQVMQLADLIRRRLGPDQLVVSTWTGDAHPDHDAVGRAALAAVAGSGATLWQMPIWARHWARPGDGTLDGPGWGRIGLDADARLAKRRATAHHVSQVAPLSDHPGDESLLSTQFLAHFDSDYEQYLVACGPFGTTDEQLGG